MVVRQNGNVCVTIWQDTRPVTFMSSAHIPVDITVVLRKKKDNSIVHLDCPVRIADYNKYMGGVDKGDQLRKYYHVRNKSHKYYRYIFWFLFEVCVLNSFILSRYSPYNHPNKTYIAFRECLANELVGHYNSLICQSYSSNHIYHTLICNITTKIIIKVGVNIHVVVVKLYGIVRLVINVCVKQVVPLQIVFKHHAEHNYFNPF